MTALAGIVNVTHDSFSDGGRFVTTDAAIAQGEKLLADGADWLDIGAESSNPKGQAVSAVEERERLLPVVRHFVGQGAKVSVDTYKPEVMTAVLREGVAMVNDVNALRAQGAVEAVAASNAQVVLMFARNAGPRAEVKEQPHARLMNDMVAFFSERLAVLERAGVKKERVLLDPGMGFFLGATPEPSLFVLKHLSQLKLLGCRLYVCTSRKSFIGAVLGGRPPLERGVGTVASELWAAQAGADVVRTHDVKAVREALTVWRAIERAR
ncbi:MAG: dihydropteroate synthase [Myxococcaceae bacterium]|nr:dihydropteroate synthase [Myxococcaceae bacterium]